MIWEQKGVSFKDPDDFEQKRKGSSEILEKQHSNFWVWTVIREKSDLLKYQEEVDSDPELSVQI